jgi:hypothetical protein
MFLNAPVGISGEDRLKCSFTMPAKAINLNKHGAAVQISRDLVAGSVILVKNKRGIQVSARIVSQLTATQEFQLTELSLSSSMTRSAISGESRFLQTLTNAPSRIP